MLSMDDEVSRIDVLWERLDESDGKDEPDELNDPVDTTTI